MDVWAQGIRQLQKLYLSTNSFLEIWTALSRQISIKEQEEATYIAKFLWQRRNETIYQNKFSYPNLLIRQAKTNLINFTLAASLNSNTQTDGTSSNTTKWHKSPSSFLKLNWDVACNS